MSRYIIEGGNPLEGRIRVKAAKNSVLPLLAASILTKEKVTLQNCPEISDIRNMLKILAGIGCIITRDDSGNITIDAHDIYCDAIPCVLAKELRSSIFLMGPMLSRMKKARISYPGGCEIGMRPIDIHLSGLRELGISIDEESGYLDCDASGAHSAQILLDLPSVGATENLMMASVFIRGVTVIRNCAKEPEIADLQNFLNAMGARISGAGSSMITVEGVEKLHGVTYTPIPDRIIAGTYMIAAAICGGEVLLRNVCPEHINSLSVKLREAGAEVKADGSEILVRSEGRLRSPGCIETRPYPGFPTDLQAPIGVFASVAEGTTVVVENIFETRFKHVAELTKMGASVKVKDKVAVFTGVKALSGAETTAMDLRGGAALVVAGLKAQGTTVVNDIHHIERGYEAPEKILSSLGADIVKV